MVFGWNAKKTAYLMLAIFVTTVVLVGLAIGIQQLDVEALPEEWQKAAVPIVAFVTSGSGLFLVSVGRNIIGFLRNWWRTKGKETYDVSRLYATWFYYYGTIGTVLALPIPSPYKEIAILIIVMLDFLTSELGKLQ